MDQILTLDNKIVEDERKMYLFTMPDGRTAGTKSSSKEEAKSRIENCLNVKLKEVE